MIGGGVVRVILVGAALVALSGCAARQAHEAQAWAVGRSIAELEQCAGKPAATDALPDGTTIAQWDYAEPNASAAVPVPLALIGDLVFAPLALVGSTSASVSTAGACHAIATLRGGVVTQLRYSGPNGGVSGPDAVCAPIMRACLGRRSDG